MKLVLVHWIDSHGGRGWRDIGEIDRAAEPLPCKSVGWLSMETPEVLLLVPHVAGEGASVELVHQGMGDMCIPKCCVRSIEVLREE